MTIHCIPCTEKRSRELQSIPLTVFALMSVACSLLYFYSLLKNPLCIIDIFLIQMLDSGKIPYPASNLLFECLQVMESLIRI